MALNIRKAGSVERGVMLALMGERGSGKTTLAASFPGSVVVAVEDGTQALAEMETPVADFEVENGATAHRVLLTMLRELADAPYRTVIVDSVTALLNKMTWDLVKNEPPSKRNLASAGRGYYEARGSLLTQIEEVLNACQWLTAKRKKHVVWVMHQKVGTVPRPDRDDMQRVEGEGEAKAIAAILNPCDLVGMVQLVAEALETPTGMRVEGTGERELLVGSHPALSTKSRWHRTLTTIPVEYGVNPLPTIVR